MNLIFMLTQGDRTVPNCLEVLEEVLPLGIGHVGFKDVGVPMKTLQALSSRLRDAGVTSYFEVVSETPEACRNSARTAVKLGIERLLGGTDIGDIGRIIAGSDISYFPFAGYPRGHPTELGGTPSDVEEHCRAFMRQGAAGVDLLAYRAVDADPIELVRAARRGLEDGELIVAGSIEGPEQLQVMHDLGVDSVTIGTSLFSGHFAPGQKGIAAQHKAAINCVAALG